MKNIDISKKFGTRFAKVVVYLGIHKVVGMKRILYIFIFALPLFMGAQDIHFSQFYMSPLNLNPAMTGVMNCKMRFLANYRNQWAPILKSKSFNTFNLSFDQKIPVGRYDYFGFGGTFWGDKAGSLDFSTLQFKLSGAYSKRMAGSRTSAHYLVFGAEGGINQRSINFHNALFGDQIDAGVGPSGRTTVENTKYSIDPGFLFADVAIGILWFSVLDKENNYYIGGSFSHLNEPLQNHYSPSNPNFTASPLYSKLTVHGGGIFAINKRTAIVPGIVTFIQGPHFQVNGGTSFRFDMSKSRYDKQSFQAGLWTRISNKLNSGIHSDAVILSTRFDYNKFGIGLSYDVNVSGLRKASPANNSFEFSFIYNICGTEKRGIYCPNF